MSLCSMDDSTTAGDLSKFLEKVDEIGGLVKNLTATDDVDASTEAIKRADDYLNKKSSEDHTSVSQDRTVINRGAHSGCGTSTDDGDKRGPSTAEQSDFMRSVEEDARERAEWRKEREKVGKEWKKKGTRAFRSSDFHSAVDCYSKAILEMPWDITLYANRALCYNNISSYKEAISDCDQAIRFWPNNLRAYVHKAKALTGLKEYTQAEECYTTAQGLFPGEKTQLDSYLKELKELQSGSEQPT